METAAPVLACASITEKALGDGLTSELADDFMPTMMSCSKHLAQRIPHLQTRRSCFSSYIRASACASISSTESERCGSAVMMPMLTHSE